MSKKYTEFRSDVNDFWMRLLNASDSRIPPEAVFQYLNLDSLWSRRLVLFGTVSKYLALAGTRHSYGFVYFILSSQAELKSLLP